jgi:hypothetical protein
VTFILVVMVDSSGWMGSKEVAARGWMSVGISFPWLMLCSMAGRITGGVSSLSG